MTTFKQFVGAVNPRYQWYRHCEVIASVVERVASGELKRVMIFVPPRHSKSETVSRLFSAYYLMRNPDKWVGLTSYSSELAYVLSRASQENYLRSGARLSAKAGAVKHWETQAGGGLWAAGVGGPITGKGFHCFPAGTTVQTIDGPMAIDALYRLQDRPKVLSFNHETNALEWRSIVAAAASDGKPLVEIALHSGRRVRCTTDHPIYCFERGYGEADALVPGETVMQIPKVQELPTVQRGNGSKCALPEVLSAIQTIALSNQVRVLWRRISQTAERVNEVARSELQRVLLWACLQSAASQYKESATMQAMPTAGYKEDSTVLQRMLRSASRYAHAITEAIAGHCMRFLSDYVSSAQLSNGLLREGLSEFRAFGTYEGQRQQPLSQWNELRGLVPEDEADYKRARWSCLRGMRGQGFFASDETQTKGWHSSDQVTLGNSPYRPPSAEQSSRELSHALRRMSQGASLPDGCWQADTVSSVTRLRETPERVYDIQVEGNSNFFADGILVHNCGIIDDPLKNAEEALSEVIREKQKEWYRSTFYTRAEPDASVIVIQTRWHQDDLAGWLLSEESEESAEGWHIVSLPAIAEAQPAFPDSCTVSDDWREDGAALCPERFDLDRLAQIRSRIGEYYFSALYQQRPTAKEGAFFKTSELKIVNAPPAILRTCRAWDLAASTKGDYTAGVKIGVDADGLWYVLDVVRGQWLPDDRNKVMAQTAAIDGRNTRIRLAQDPGQAGVDQAQALTRMLAGYGVRAERVSGAKEARADAVAAQVNAGNFRLVDGRWNTAFIEELRQFPMGKNDDQIDALSDAFNELVGNGPIKQWNLQR